MSVLLIDDHLLLRVLLGDEPSSMRTEDVALATTGLWYHRLCRALCDDRVVGSMSKRLGGVDVAIASDVLGAVIALPETIELISLRSLGWDMATQLHAGTRLNLLGLEALAAARHLGADVCLAEVDDNPSLRAAAGTCGITVRTIRA